MSTSTVRLVETDSGQLLLELAASYVELDFCSVAESLPPSAGIDPGGWYIRADGTTVLVITLMPPSE